MGGRRHAKGPDRAPLHAGGENFCGYSGSDLAGLRIDDGGASEVRRILSPAGLRLLEPVAFAVQFQDVDVMGQPVEKRAGETLIAEDARPFVERQIGCDDRRAAFVTLAEDLEQQFGAGLRERHVAEFVDDQQLDGGELRLELEQAPFVARLHELMDERRRGGEGDGKSSLAGGETQRQGDMGLARAAVAESDDVVAGDDVFATSKFQNVSGLLSEGIAVKSNVSKLFTAGKRAARMRRSTMRRSRSMSSSSTRRRRIADMIVALARGLGGDLFVFPQHGRQLELAEMMGEQNPRRRWRFGGSRRHHAASLDRRAR